MKQWILEGCVDSVQSAKIAEKAGANRLELCENLLIGGTTPTFGLLKETRESVEIPIHVLVRPRFGDFCYDQEEVEVMRRDIQILRREGADGFVIGALKYDGSLDLETMKILIEAAGDSHIVLHRAFDMCKDPFQTLEEAKKLGVQTILTSGQENQCVDGTDLLKHLKEYESEIDFLAGSGIKAENIEEIYKKTGILSYHMSGKVTKDSKMRYRNPRVHMGLDGFSEYEVWETGEENIRNAVKVLETIVLQ